MDVGWGRMGAVEKCSDDDGCGLREIPAGKHKPTPVNLKSAQICTQARMIGIILNNP